VKIIRVDNCRKSPLKYGVIYPVGVVCRLIERRIDNPETIHPDCPLEDAKEANDGR